MDLIFTTPNPVVTNLMGSDFVQVPELESGEAFLASPNTALRPPPPLTPAPSQMEEVLPAAPTAPEQLASNLSNVSVSEQVKFFNELPAPPINQTVNNIIPIQPIVPTPPSSASTGTTTTGLQIMTRKRSSMSAVNSGTLSGTAVSPSAGTTSIALTPIVPGAGSSVPVNLISNSNATSSASNASASQPPPKKKKKYTPKPKKSPQSAGTVATGSMEGKTEGNAIHPTQSKPKNATIAITSTEPKPTNNGTEVATIKPAAKPKKPSKPKAPKKPSSSSGGSSKSRSKKGKQAPASGKNVPGGTTEATGNGPVSSNMGASQQKLVPPLRLHMPKLMKMPGAQVMPSILPMKSKVKSEPQDWNEHGDQLDPMMLAETEMNEDGSEESGTGKGSSRKKKSKGRNGNIYIGVFNRIEWMKLQNEFGFGSVNNFGTFVLQTMRRVHGDIQFWCDVAVASGVYSELDHYEWTNGFPHAVNKDGQHFTPEPNVSMSDEKREEVIELAKGMWEQRLQQLKQLQQELTGEEEVEVVDGDEDEEEEEDVMPDLENYLENMATGQYSPSVALPGGLALPQSTGGDAYTKEEVNKIWNEQMSDLDNLEKFGKLFSFVNSIESDSFGIKKEGIGIKDNFGAKAGISENQGEILGGLGIGVDVIDGKNGAVLLDGASGV